MEEIPQEVFKQRFDWYMEDFDLTDEELRSPLLDVGAGSGAFIYYLRHNLGNKNAFGVSKYIPKSLKHDEGFVVTDGRALPFRDDTFEIVLARNYVPIFSDTEEEYLEAINELIRVTKPGGKIMCNVSTPEEQQEDQMGLDPKDEYYKSDLEYHERRKQTLVKANKYFNKLIEDGFEISMRKGDKAILVIKKP